MTMLTHCRCVALKAVALFKRRETNTFHIPGDAHHHAHVYGAHTCVKLKLSQPYI